MTNTTTTAPELAERVSYSEITRIVMKAHPELIEAMERALREFYENEDGWQENVSRHQRAAGMPERSLESPYGQALREASTAVFERGKELLAAGAVTRRTTGINER